MIRKLLCSHQHLLVFSRDKKHLLEAFSGWGNCGVGKTSAYPQGANPLMGAGDHMAVRPMLGFPGNEVMPL